MANHFSQHNAYYGMYLNMARHNAFLIISEVSIHFDFKVPDEEEYLSISEIVQYFNNANQLESQRKIVAKLASRLPWLKVIIDEFETYNEQNSQVAQQAQNRAYYFAKQDNTLNKVIYEQLTQTFDLLDTLRNTYSHHHAKALVPYPFAIKPFYEDALRRLFATGNYSKFKGKYKEEDINWLSLNQPIETRHFVPFRENDNVESINEKWLIYFTCLFLEEKYAFLFLGDITTFKDTRYNNDKGIYYKATLDQYTMFCCHLPYPKLGSSDIALDMLNGLARCPEILFDLLCEADREQLKEVVNDKSVKDETYDEFLARKNSAIKRHDDRFPYFILRYFDDMNVFDKMRFQVRLGRRKQLFINSDETDTSIRYNDENLKVINRFGRLTDFNADNMPEEWKAKIHFGEVTEDNDVPHISYEADMQQFAPKYNFLYENQTVIALKLNPQATDWGNTNDRPELADAFLSTYELPNLFLLTLWGGKDEAFNVIEKYVTSFKNFLTDFDNGRIQPVANTNAFEKKRYNYEGRRKIDLDARNEQLDQILTPYGLKRTYLPDVFREHLLNYKPANEHDVFEKRLEKDKREVDKRTKRDKQNNFQYPKALENIVNFLSEDIVQLKPLEGYAEGKNSGYQKGKPNRKDFRKLETSFAYFLQEKSNLAELFKKLQLTEGEKKHPFLEKINILKCNDIRDFYRYYVYERQKWSVDAQVAFESQDLETFKSQYGYAFNVKIKLAVNAKHIKHGIMLPRGLFNNAIIQAYKNNATEPSINDSTQKPSDLIRQMLNNDRQKFYEYSRNCEVTSYRKNLESDKNEKIIETWDVKKRVEKLEKDIKRSIATLGDNEAIQKYATDKRLDYETAAQRIKFKKKDLIQEYNALIKQHQKIRYHLYTDRVLLMAIQDIFKKRRELNQATITFTEQPQLQNVKTVLKTKADVTYAYILSKEDTENNTPERKIYIIDNLPIKQHGAFKRILKDRRLPGLLDYYYNKRVAEQPVNAQIQIGISHERIKQELTDYDAPGRNSNDITRARLMQVIYELELKIFDAFGTAIKAEVANATQKKYDEQIAECNEKQKKIEDDIAAENSKVEKLKQNMRVPRENIEKREKQRDENLARWNNDLVKKIAEKQLLMRINS